MWNNKQIANKREVKYWAKLTETLPCWLSERAERPIRWMFVRRTWKHNWGSQYGLNKPQNLQKNVLQADESKVELVWFQMHCLTETQYRFSAEIPQSHSQSSRWGMIIKACFSATGDGPPLLIETLMNFTVGHLSDSWSLAKTSLSSQTCETLMLLWTLWDCRQRFLHRDVNKLMQEISNNDDGEGRPQSYDTALLCFSNHNFVCLDRWPLR